MRTAYSVLFVLPLVACSSASTPATPDAPDGGMVDDSGTPVVPTTCPAPTHGPTMHHSITADETWTADTSPHLLPYDSSIDAKLTLEPCSEVRIAAGRTVTISAKGSIVGIGQADKRILITRNDPATSWGSIRAFGGSLQLAYATVEGGGDPMAANTRAELAGMIAGQTGSDPMTSAADALSFKHVTVKGSMSNGVLLTGEAHFSADSDDVTITGSASHPISIFPRVVGSVPAGTYTGNTIDEILFPGSGGTEDIRADQTMHDRGVPYHVGIDSTSGQLRVGASSSAVPLATLTIEPGVTIRFKKGGYFEVESASGTNPATGALIAHGTATKPIVLTSGEAAPAPSDWYGLSFGSVTNPSTVVEYMHVDYAGLVSPSSGSLSCATGMRTAAINFSGAPATAFITNTTISHSPTGFNSGWKGAQIDFTATNTFVDVPGCKLTNPPDLSNSCAGRPPCAVP